MRTALRKRDQPAPPRVVRPPVTVTQRPRAVRRWMANWAPSLAGVTEPLNLTFLPRLTRVDDRWVAIWAATLIVKRSLAVCGATVVRTRYCVDLTRPPTWKENVPVGVVFTGPRAVPQEAVNGKKRCWSTSGRLPASVPVRVPEIVVSRP